LPKITHNYPVALPGKTNQGREIFMLTEHKKLVISFMFVVACLLVGTGPTLAGTLPSFDLTVPQNVEARNYLGLSDSGQFTIPQIEAQVVIIEIFNMY
jgi:hypothetical protein